MAKPPVKETFKNFITVAKRNMTTTNGMLYLLMFVFITTFIVFPAVTFDTELQLINKDHPMSNGWFILVMNTIFSVFDSVGRKMGGMPTFDIHTKTLKIISAFRLIFIATFYLVAFEVSPFFTTDYFIIINMTIFAFSNGYTSTLCAVKAPMQVAEDKRGQVGSFVGTCLTGGIFIGTLIALAMTPLFNKTPHA